MWAIALERKENDKKCCRGKAKGEER